MNFLPKLSSFEGPLDLLIHLIEKNEIDIYDIPIAEITDQYMEYLDEADEEDTDFLSEFLVMAATLLEIKAKMLLPADEDKDEEEEDPRLSLVEQLIEYSLFKQLSKELKSKEDEAGKSLYRKACIPEEVAGYEPPVDYERLIGGVTAETLSDIFNDVISRYRLSVNEEAKKYGKIKKDEISIPGRMDDIRAYMKAKHNTSFRKLLEKRPSKAFIIVTFLAILELMKTGEICGRQSGSDIILEWTGKDG